MLRRNIQTAVAVSVAVVALSGCGAARYHAEAAEREQRAADDLRGAGAREAATAAQDRANEHRSAMACDGFVECLLTALLSVEVTRR